MRTSPMRITRTLQFTSELRLEGINEEIAGLLKEAGSYRWK